MIQKNTSGTLGPIEANIVARLTYEKKTIVTAKELDMLFKLSPDDRKQIVFRLKRKNRLRSIKPGVYVFSPLEAGPAGGGVDEFLVPPIFFPRKNYYIGYSTLFNYYGFTEQLFQTVYVLNTTLSREKIICGVSYKFLKIPENRLYGLLTINVRNTDVIISSKERTLIDLLCFNKPVGGIESACGIFTKTVKDKKCDIRKLIEYAVKFPKIAIRKRIGLLLENAGVSDSALRPLLRSIENTSIGSFTDSRRGKLNRKWRVITNDTRR